ncbi:MAG TPA: hypothetical protein VF138_00440 [Caulobacteraceae bacterium]
MARPRLAALAMLAALAAATPVHAAESGGDLILDARLRYETVSQDGLQDAQALTLRTRLGYETPVWRGFRALAEAENVTALVDDYNSTTNGRTAYAVVADPETTELNRAQVSWSGSRGWAVLGRQRLVLGAARFVGNVGFRQNEQTFDAFRVDLRPRKDVTLTYAYLDRIHRVFGDDNPQGEWDSDTHLGQLDWKRPAGQVSAYAFLMAFENAPAQSNATYGARLAGSRAVGGELSATYEAEYARQTDHRNSPTSFDLDYLALAGGLKSGTRWASVGVERLGGDGARGFATPLATLHAFQGWADVFLTTPAAGVRDINLRAGLSVDAAVPLRLQATAHDFADADGSTGYGRELNLLLAAPINKHLMAEAKAAFFDGGHPAFANRTKVWLTLELKH